MLNALCHNIDPKTTLYLFISLRLLFVFDSLETSVSASFSFDLRISTLCFHFFDSSHLKISKEFILGIFWPGFGCCALQTLVWIFFLACFWKILMQKWQKMRQKLVYLCLIHKHWLTQKLVLSVPVCLKFRQISVAQLFGDTAITVLETSYLSIVPGYCVFWPAFRCCMFICMLWNVHLRWLLSRWMVHFPKLD